MAYPVLAQNIIKNINKANCKIFEVIAYVFGKYINTTLWFTRCNPVKKTKNHLSNPALFIFILQYIKEITMPKVLDEKIVYSSKRFVVEEAQLNDENNTYSRLRLNRRDAAAILLLNTDSNKIILTRQFRYAVSSKSKEPILEIIAGIIDEGEEPVDAAIRETEEETGYKIKKGNISHLITCFASPGYSTERLFVYFATAGNEDKIAQGGGLQSENEHIELVEIDLKEFTSLVRNGKIEDAKTYLAALYILATEQS